MSRARKEGGGHERHSASIRRCALNKIEEVRRPTKNPRCLHWKEKKDLAEPLFQTASPTKVRGGGKGKENCFVGKWGRIFKRTLVSEEVYQKGEDLKREEGQK